MSGRGARRWTATAPTRRHLQVVLGLLWLLDAVLECQPAMFHADFFGNMLLMSSSAPPPWLWGLITKVEPVVTAHAAAANAVAVGLQFAIGLGLLWPRTVRPALALSIPWALTVWLFGEAGGGIFVQGANALTGAPGAALVYAAVALLLWPRRPDDGAAAGDNGLLARSASVLVWAALWVGTAALEAGFLNRSPTYAAQAMDNAAAGGPGWLHAAGTAVGALVGNHGALFAASSGLLQSAVGLGVLVPQTRRLALGAGAALAVFYTVVGQAFGGLFSNGVLGIMRSGATDPGTGPVIVLLALALWPRRSPVTAVARGEPPADAQLPAPTGGLRPPIG